MAFTKRNFPADGGRNYHLESKWTAALRIR